MKNSLIALLVLSLSISLTASNIHLKNYPAVRIAKLKGTPGKIAAIPLDHQFYKKTNADYSNIRIIDNRGNIVPFAVRNVMPLKNRKIFAELPFKLSGYQINEEKKYAEIDLNLNYPVTISRLTFPAEKQFESAEITLTFFNHDGLNMGEDQIFRLPPPSTKSDVINVDFPAIKANKIHLILKLSDKNALEKAETFLKKMEVKELIFLEIPGTPKIITVNLPEISRRNQGSLTEIIADAHKIPCCKLKITCDDKKYDRYMEIFSKTNQKEQCIVSQNITEKNNIVPLPEVRGEYYIIRIHNSGQPPLKNIRLQWMTKERVLMFIPPEQGDLKIYYGGHAKQMTYDIEYADRYGLPPQIYELEAETVSPDYEPQIPTIDLYKYFSWLIIIIAAMLFLLTVVRMLNKSKDWDDCSH